MSTYEYKVVPAPEKAQKIRGLKGSALFAAALEEVMNEMASDGWSYLRAETLPQEERSGLTAKTTTYRNLLVFQRPVQADAIPSPEPVASVAVAPEPATTEPTVADPSDENLWDEPTSDELGHEEQADPQPLFPNRQREGVDL